MTRGRAGDGAAGLSPRLLQAARDRLHRTTPARRVRGEHSALAFLKAVGFAFLFDNFGTGLPFLWAAVCGRREPRWPRHTHHDPGIGLAWHLKDVLPARRRVYYGKLLLGKPTLVALPDLPAAVAWFRRKTPAWHRVAFLSGRMSRAGHAVLEVLHAQHPLYTPDLRRAAGLAQSRETRIFERAIAELQQGLWVVKSEERYEPSFAYRWDLFEARYPRATAAAERIAPAEALGRLAGRLLDTLLWSTPRELGRLLRPEPGELEGALADLEARGRLVRGTRIPGLPPNLLLSRRALEGLSSGRSRRAG
ncbi:MAG: hypothetical protein HYT86_03970 [candidate division NC10 bacterium]|nr:hypothetical protein [candidate division NC10 bacterium]